MWLSSKNTYHSNYWVKNIYFFISTFCTYQYLYFSIFVIVMALSFCVNFFITDAALENGQIMEHEI